MNHKDIAEAGTMADLEEIVISAGMPIKIIIEDDQFMRFFRMAKPSDRCVFPPYMPCFKVFWTHFVPRSIRTSVADVDLTEGGSGANVGVSA